MMDLTEKLVAGAASHVLGTTSIPGSDEKGAPPAVDLMSPWRRATMNDLVKEKIGTSIRRVARERKRLFAAFSDVILFFLTSCWRHAATNGEKYRHDGTVQRFCRCAGVSWFCDALLVLRYEKRRRRVGMVSREIAKVVLLGPIHCVSNDFCREEREA